MKHIQSKTFEREAYSTIRGDKHCHLDVTILVTLRKVLKTKDFGRLGRVDRRESGQITRIPVTMLVTREVARGWPRGSKSPSGAGSREMTMVGTGSALDIDDGQQPTGDNTMNTETTTIRREPTEAEEAEWQREEDDLNDEAAARERSYQGARECFIRGEMTRDEFDKAEAEYEDQCGYRPTGTMTNANANNAPTLEESISQTLNAAGRIVEVGGGIEIVYVPDNEMFPTAVGATAAYACACDRILQQLTDREHGLGEDGESLRAATSAWSVEFGRKYFKVIRHSASRPDSHRSAWAFVDKDTGDLYRAASFAKKGSLLGNLLSGEPVHHLPTC